MKRILIFLGILVPLLVLQGCEKDTYDLGPYIPSGPSQPSNTAPTVRLGENYPEYPFKKILLTASVGDRENNIESYRWTKISGSDGPKIENPTTPTTVVSNLVDGDYEFELEVKDSRGLSAKDIVLVSVRLKPENTDERIFKDLVWDSEEWYQAIYINQIKYIVEPGRSFKVYIQRGDNPEWINVIPWSDSENQHYNYQINYHFEAYGALLIYSPQYERFAATVKIIFE